jgi:hypothetical protein
LIKIIGAGMAGLLAARMLRHHDPVVLEAQDKLPNNHSAVLRFRSPAVGDVLGIDFMRVKMIKSYLPWKNPVADSMAYANKNGGTYRSDRSIVSSGIETNERWIAPPDLIERMAEGVSIKFSAPYDFSSIDDKVVSTIPMPVLGKAMGHPIPPFFFESIPGLNVRARIDKCEAYVSLMIPDPQIPFSRVSITGDELIVEVPRIDFAGSQWVDPVSKETAFMAAELLGIDRERLGEVSGTPQRYAKILPIDESWRRDFIYWASTVKGRAYSLGRFATWRPGLLMDDLIKDIRLIDGWIKSRTSAYDQESHEAAKRFER